MKKYIILLFPFLSCSVQNKLKIETILAAPARVTSQNVETGRTYPRSTYVIVTPLLDHAILMLNQSDKTIDLLLQGNISSSGLSINNIKKIRLKKTEQVGDVITLKYYVEIVNISGKEGSTVQGYNYSKVESYKIPDKVKTLKVELYEDRISQRTGSKLPKLKLVAEHFFDLTMKNKPIN